MAAIAVAGVGMMVMCSSSVAAAMMMGGGDGDDDSSGAGAGAGAGAEADVEKEYIVVDESHLSEYKGGTVETGAGTSVEDCRKLAYDGDYAAFGFRKAPHNSCWAIVDGRATTGKVAPLAGHVVGCVTAGEDINTGCNTTKTNVIRARHYKGVTEYENIDCTSIPTCRTAATAAGANHFGWRETGGNGWVVKAPDISSTTPEFMVHHTIGCTDPTKIPPNC
jgi:hypothetical protein